MNFLSRPPAAPLWVFVFRRLPELLLGVEWVPLLEAWRGDIDGQEFHVYESEPWQLVLATGKRLDLVDWLASRKQLPRGEIIAAMQAARAELELPAQIGGEGAPAYASGPSAEAMQYAGGRG